MSNNIGKENDEYMLKEYDTLRSEILQIYGEQSRLVFVSGVAVVGIILAKLIGTSIPLFLLPSVLFIVLTGLGVKSWANYHRIFRIGTYLAVVHERRGALIKYFIPSAEQPAWHNRWREISTKIWWVGSEGPFADAVFLAFLAIAGGFFIFALPKAEKITDALPWFQQHELTINIVLGAILAVVLVALALSKQMAKFYGDRFTNLVRQQQSERRNSDQRST